MSFLQHVQNRAKLQLSSAEYFAAIIGAAPSKGARSPTLWNRAFRALGLSGLMHPFDVAPDGLAPVLAGLKADPKFIGGAIAVPYKQEIVPLLDEVEGEARAIGAVNAIFRRGDRLVGTNTDGAAALASAHRLAGDLTGRKVLLLGVGGAGRAVAAYIARALGRDGWLFLANRSGTIGRFCDQLESWCHVERALWPVEHGTLREVDLVINCTSIGSELVKADTSGAFSLLAYTPLAAVDGFVRVAPGDAMLQRFARANAAHIRANIAASWDAIEALEDTPVYDIVYQPTMSLLLTLARSRGLRTASGEAMNLDQAVLAFARAIESFAPAAVDHTLIRKSMATDS